MSNDVFEKLFNDYKSLNIEIVSQLNIDNLNKLYQYAFKKWSEMHNMILPVKNILNSNDYFDELYYMSKDIFMRQYNYGTIKTKLNDDIALDDAFKLVNIYLALIHVHKFSKGSSK